jgi:GntP family gluconate:H+ symporter
MGVGLLVGIVPLLVGGLLWGYIINRFVDAKPGDVLGVSQEELTERAQKSDEELPSLMMSLLPFVFPVVLLTAAAVLKTYYPEDDSPGWLMLLGDKNLVFFAGAAAGLWLLFSQKTHSLRSTFASLEPAIASGAVIAFITSAGGAFGESLAQAGIGGLIAETAQDANISLLVLAFLTAALIRIAQGSATVAMTTTAGIIAPSLGLVELGFHPAYLVAVIGLAATGFSWMNDSGFWLVSKLTGLNEAQTLASFTASLSLVALSGFAWVWVLIQVLPLV